jgi:hypothetical protein
MGDVHPVVWFVQLFVFLLGVAVGHSIIQLKIHREENRKKELELALFEKRGNAPSPGARSASELEEDLYNARVRQEIDDILSKG